MLNNNNQNEIIPNNKIYQYGSENMELQNKWRKCHLVSEYGKERGAENSAKEKEK